MAILTESRPPPVVEVLVPSAERQARMPPSRGASTRPPLSALLVAVAASGVAITWSAVTHSMLLYGDARAHLDVARHVTDALTPGLAQLGSVWLPMPHILLAPFVAITPLWHNGAAGAIVSGLCFVYTALRIFSLVEELSSSRLGAWCGMAVFILNLNILYIQTTALTEPVLLAFMVGAVFHLTRWMRTLEARELLWGALFVFFGTLTRYEGWALLMAALVAVAVWARLADRRHKSPRANLMLFASVACYGLVLWFLYNLIIFHDPLYFLHSDYSAQAINGGQAKFGLLATKGSVWNSMVTYGWTVVDVVGTPVLIVTGAWPPSAIPSGVGPCSPWASWPHRSSSRWPRSTPGRPPSGSPRSPTTCGTTATAWWPSRCAPWPPGCWPAGGDGPGRWWSWPPWPRP